MNIKSARYLVGALLLIGLSALTIACGVIEPPSPSLPVATIAPPAVPHSIEGRSDCRVCHEAGLGGAPQFPASHSERPSDVCLTCHVPPSGGSPLATMPTPPAETKAPESAATEEPVLAAELYQARCAACHGANRQGVPGFAPALTPESLAALSESEIKNTISAGRPGTAMPAFNTLSPEEVDALFQLINSPVSE